ncbi:hypothetical protein ACOMHN_008129 [Nucella lapillus]
MTTPTTTISTTTITPFSLTTSLPEVTLTPVMANTSVTLTPEEQAQIRDYLWTMRSIKESYIWVIMAFGFPGNLLSLLVICRMRSLGSPALYISTLAVVDNLAIVVKVILLQFGQYQVLIGLVSCKLMLFLGNYLVVFANWVLVAMAIERFFAVWQPLRVAHTWTSRRAAIGLTVLLLVTLTLASPLFVTVTVKNFGNRQTCSVDPQYRQVMRVWQWGQAAAYGFLPCTLLFALNISIIVLIGRARRLHLSLTSSSSSSSKSSSRHHHPPSSHSAIKRQASNHCATSTQDPQSGHHHESCSPHKKKNRTPNRQQQHSKKKPPAHTVGVQRQATILLLVTSAVLVITTTPVCVYLLVQQWWLPQPGSVELARKQLCALVLRVVCDANHAVNFYLYFVSARKFRAYLWKALCWFCLREKGRRNSDVITRHLSMSRSTLRVKSSGQCHLLASPRREDRSGREERDERENSIPLKMFEGDGVHCNGRPQDIPLL